MKKKATLLLQHLETIYPMISSHATCVHHGFIAFHHDCILAMGEGEGWDFVDKDTRIMEGRNHIAVPGFIDVCMQVQLPKDATHASILLSLREQGEVRMKNGTLIGNLIQPRFDMKEAIEGKLDVPYEFDYQNIAITKNYPIVYPLDIHQMQVYKRFCISSGSQHSIDCLDQFLCAKLYHRATNVDARSILAACTMYPARALGLSKVGSIAKGYKGNVLVMEGHCFEDVLTSFHGHPYMQVIKEGTRILPYILI